MAKTTAPFGAPVGKKWCVMHNKNAGAFLLVTAFPNEKYSYCRECKREYQRNWERTKRVRPNAIVVPNARLSKNQKKIIVHLPNNEKGRNVTREMFKHFPDVELEW